MHANEVTDLTFSFTCSLAIMGNLVIECVQWSCITSVLPSLIVLNYFMDLFFTRIFRSKVESECWGMSRTNYLARCLHWVLHWVNLFWWRDLCQPDPGHNWSPHLPHLTDISTPSDTEYPCVAAQGDKRWWWPDCGQTGLQSSVQHSDINMDFWIFLSLLFNH